MVGEAAYPNLGFDPVPGVPERVEALGAKIATAVDSLGQAGGLLGRLRDSGAGVWQGAAGDAFRAHVDEHLVTGLTNAHASLDKAVGLLRGWHTDLVGFKDTAAALERQAAEARRQHAQAQDELRQAQGSPDLGLAGRSFPDQASLQRAQGLLDAAESAVRSAGAKVGDTQAALEAVIRRAKELEGQHDAVARRIADELRHATDGLAPHEPGLLSRLAHDFTSAVGAVDGWVKNHLDEIHSALTTISAISGLVALLTPPPVDAIAFAVSLAAGAGALGVDAADPKFRHGISQLAHGHFDKESLGAAKTGGLDLLAMVPGIGVASKTVKGAEAVGEGVADLPRIVGLASNAAQNPSRVVRLVAKIPGVDSAVEAAGLIKGSASEQPENVLKALNKLWHGKSVVSDLYHDAKQAAS